MGSRRDCTWILGLSGFRVERVDGEDGDATSRVQIRIERRGQGASRRESLPRRLGSDAPEKRPRHLGLDEIQRGKGQHFWTVLSDVVHGEVIGLRKNRDEASATALLTEELTARQRAAVTAVCTDMHRPYLNAVGTVLKQAEIVFDKFHVLQHASAALDEVRRQEFFRAGAVMREHGRGKRWLLLRRWKTVRGSKRAELQNVVRRKPSTVQSLCTPRAARSALDVQDAAGRVELSARLDQGVALATPA